VRSLFGDIGNAIAVWGCGDAIAFGLLGVRSLFGYVGMSDRFWGVGVRSLFGDVGVRLKN
jgi:hypothetical protein